MKILSSLELSLDTEDWWAEGIYAFGGKTP